jgi:hypothetical protein
MSVEHRTFRPLAATQTVSASDANTNLALSMTLGARAIRIYNAGPNTVYWWNTGVAAVATSVPMPSGAIETFSIGPDVTNLGFICSTAQTATVYVTVGEGL